MKSLGRPPRKRGKGDPAVNAGPPQEFRGVGGPGGRPSVLSMARDAWNLFSMKHTGLKIPVWYSGLYGVPAWYLRQRCTDFKSDHRRGIALIARMNYILDFPEKFYGKKGADCRRHLPGRPLRAFLETFGCIYSEGEYSPVLTGGFRTPSMAYAASRSYDWKCALICTLRSFVHLLALIKGPSPVALRSCSLPETRKRLSLARRKVAHAGEATV
jgi:hypothetical protein